MKKINRFLCRIFGHSYNILDFTMFQIEMKAINRKELQPEINCKRCGHLTKVIS